MFPGIGTLVNVVTVLLGTVLGVLVGHRLRQRTRDVVTDGLGLVTLLIAGTAAAAVADEALVACPTAGSRRTTTGSTTAPPPSTSAD